MLRPWIPSPFSKMDGLNEAINAVSVVGFPAATCWFVLYRLDYSLKKLETAVHDLARAMAANTIKN